MGVEGVTKGAGVHSAPLRSAGFQGVEEHHASQLTGEQGVKGALFLPDQLGIFVWIAKGCSGDQTAFVWRS